jgi:two-component system, cell cycle sensor histidine kinase and response regulator CckA
MTAAAEFPAPPEVSTDTSRLRVLLVEDNYFDAQLIENELRTAGFALRIDQAQDREGFLAALALGPDLVLFDYHLPAFDVFAAMDLAGDQEARPAFVVVTGYSGDAVAAECIKRGAADYVLKDHLSRLPQVVKAVIEQQALRRAARLAEEKIFASEAFKSAILDSALDCVVGMDTEGRIIEFNPAAEKTFGYTREEAMGRTVADLIIPTRFREMHKAGFANYLATAQGRVIGRRVETLAIRKGGEEFAVELAICEVPLPDRKVFTAVIRDISSRLEMERSLRESEERFRSLVQNSRDVIAVVDRDGTFTFVSPVVEALSGHTPEELVGTPGIAHIHPEDREALQDELARILESPREPRTLEVRTRTRTGEFIWIEIRAANRLHDPGVKGIVLNYHDVSERRRALDDLRRSQKSMADAQAITHLGSFEWDPKSGRVAWSDEQYRIFGYEPGSFEPTEATFLDAVHPDDRAGIVEVNERCMSTGGCIDHEYRIRRPDGSERRIQARTNGELKDGVLVRLFGSNQDVTDRRRVEEEKQQLIERQQELDAHSRLILESTGEGMWGVDEHGRCTFVNRAAAEALGYEIEDLLGKSVHEIIHHSKPDGSPYPVEECPTYLAVREGTRTTRSSEIFWRADGSMLPVEYSAYPILRDGHPSGAVVSFKDVSERIRMEEALKSSESLFRGAFRAAQTGIALIDADARTYVEVNQALCDMLGYTKDELLQLDWVQITHPDDREINLERVRRLRTGQDDVAFLTKRYVRKDGSLITVEISDALLRDPDGHLQYFVTHVVDVTERLGAAQRLKESQELLQGVIDNSPALIYVKRTDGRFILANDRFSENFGVSSADIVGKTFRELMPADLADRLSREDSAALIGLGPVEREEKIPNSQGEDRTYLSVRFPLIDDDDRPYAVCGVSTDLSERVKAEEERSRLEGQLRQALKMEAVGQLAGGVAHDFNNILAVILNYAAFVAEDLPEGHPGAEDLAEIVKAGEKAAKLVHQLLAFSRKEVIEEQVVDLNWVINDLRELLTRSIGEDVLLDTNLASGLARTKADPGQLEQVLINLAVNARDAMPGGGALTITTANREVTEGESPGLEAGSYVMLQVADSGTGMDASTADRIFEPFFTTKPRGEGTGLGLATVYGIVKQARGGIYVDSEIGGGTSFTVYLPATTAEDAAPAALEAASPSPAAAELILVVEDDDAVRDLVTRILTKNGYQVVAKSSGADAVAHCQVAGAAIDLLLTDVIMPEMSGKEVADKIRTLAPHIKTLFMSGYTDELIAKRTILESGRNLINKPFDGTQLVARVRDVLAERKAS